MKADRKNVVYTSIASFFIVGGLILAGALGALGTRPARTGLGQGESYTLVFDKDHNVPGGLGGTAKSGDYTVHTSLGNPLTFAYTNAVSNAGGFLALTDGGTFGNPNTDAFGNNAITKLTKLTASFTGTLKVAHGASGASSAPAPLTSGSEYAFGSPRPAYFEISASGAASITSLTVTYLCDFEETLTEYDVSKFYGGYYNSIASWTDGSDLKEQLYDVMRTGYTASTYDGNWTTNQNADQSLTNFDCVHQVYSDDEILKTSTYNNTNTDGWQREHAFAASLMTGQTTGDAVKTKGTATDFHNLFASYHSGNGSRGNKNFGNVTGGSSIGNATYSTTLFCPADQDKGRLARAIFYMATMFGDDAWVDDSYVHGLRVTEDIVTYDSGNPDTYHRIGKLNDLLGWNDGFKPERVEFQHNNYVAGQQHDRNPYVDYPQLVDYVFGSKKDEAGELKYLKPTSLDLGVVNADGTKNTATYGMAIGNVKYEYEVNEQYSLANDLDVYKVNYDYSTSPITNYSSTISNNYKFVDGDVGTKTVTISAPGYASVTYPLVVKPTGLTACNYVYPTTDKTVFQSTGAKTLNGISWNLSYTIPSGSSFEPGGKSMVTTQNSPRSGVKIGTKDNHPSEIILETASDFSYQFKEIVDRICLEANCGANQTCTVTFYLNGTSVGPIDNTFDSDPKVRCVHLTDNAGRGKVKIVISSISGYVVLYNLGVSAVSS